MTSMPTPMAPTTANWHWKSKSVTPWAKAWFERELVALQVEGSSPDEFVKIDAVKDVEGDVELGQRKSKLITIYDCKLELKWSGVASDGTQVKGKLTIPEVSHEITLDGTSDYTYHWSMSEPSPATPAANALYTLAKSKLSVALETKFAVFPTAIIDVHGKDLTVTATNTPNDSRTGTPAPAAPAPSTPAPSVSAAKSAPEAKKAGGTNRAKLLNTSTIRVEARFMASADDLFSLLTDEKRIPQWSRAPAQSNPSPGADYSLFGGGVRGTYESVSPPTTVVQNWILQSPTWPAGHSATLTTTFEQQTDSTNIIWSLEGVPKGMEDEIQRNLEGYYVRGLKSIGYVQLITAPSFPPAKSPSSQPRHGDERPPNEILKGWMAVALISSILVAVFGAPYLLGKGGMGR